MYKNKIRQLLVLINKIKQLLVFLINPLKIREKICKRSMYETCHNGFPLDLDDHKNKRSRHRPFLYGCDRSPRMHVLKLGTEIPNHERHYWSTK